MEMSSYQAIWFLINHLTFPMFRKNPWESGCSEAKANRTFAAWKEAAKDTCLH